MNLNPLTLIRNAASAAMAKLGLVRTDRVVTRFDTRQQPTGLVTSANVERIHAIMESADAGDPRDLFALYQEIVLTDSHLQGEFAKRKLAVLGDAMAILPADKKDAADMAAAEAVREMISGDGMVSFGCKGWMGAMVHLLDSILWPVAVVEKVWEPVGAKFHLAELVPVPDQLLDFTDGRLKIRLTDERGTPTGVTEELDPARYIVHRGHLLTFPDHRGGPLRSLVWWWLLTTMDREWWVRFLERFGAPFLVGKYDQSDDASRSVLQSAFSYATKIGGLVVSRETEVEVVQAQTGSASDAYERFLAIGQAEKSKLIVGQTLSSEKGPGGLGQGASGLHGQVRGDIRQWDAAQLCATLQRELFGQFMAANQIRGHVPKIAWGGEDADDQSQTGTFVKALSDAGIELTDEGIETLGERSGLSLRRKVAVAPVIDPSAPDAPLMMGARVRLLTAPGYELADIAGDRIAEAGAEELARAFRGAFAPVRRAIRESKSAEDLEARLRLMYADYPAERLARLIEPAMVAFAANALMREQ